MKIAHINIEKPLCLAPMEAITELPFRVMCHRLGADMVYTEFTASIDLMRNSQKALDKVEILGEERPVAIQIFGGRPEVMQAAAERVEEFNPDFIDINCGCWVRDLVARNEGAGLLRNLPLFEEIVKATIKGTKLAVTVKTRLGWDQNSIVILDVAKMVEQAGAQALTLHCRTRSQAHTGKADWQWLEKVKRSISIPLIGNGDVHTPEDVKRMFDTGCDGVMIGRGALANPFIFREAKHYLKTGEYLPPISAEERIATCLEHLALSVAHKGEQYGVITFRKHYAGYLKGIPGAGDLRADLMRYTTLQQVQERLAGYLDGASCLL